MLPLGLELWSIGGRERCSYSFLTSLVALVGRGGWALGRGHSWRAVGVSEVYALVCALTCHCVCVCLCTCMHDVCVPAYVCIHVYMKYVCVVCGVGYGVFDMHVCMCANQRLMLCALPYLMRQGPSLTPELAHSTSLPGQFTPGIPISGSPLYWHCRQTTIAAHL